jgi:hypothetical protein
MAPDVGVEGWAGGRMRRRGSMEMSAQGRPRSIHGKDNDRLLHDQVVLYGSDPFGAPCDFTRFIDGMLRINEAAQLDPALVSLDTDFEGLEKIIFRKQGFYLGRDDRIIHVLARAFVCACRSTGRKGDDEHKKDQIADKQIPRFHNVYSSFVNLMVKLIDCKTFSAKDATHSLNPFRPADHLHPQITHILLCSIHSLALKISRQAPHIRIVLLNGTQVLPFCP